jgi:glutamyl-tRNA reductase
MSMNMMNPAVEHAQAPVREPSAALLEHERSIHRARPESTGANFEDDAAVCSASPPHRRHAAAVLRGLGGRTDVALRRELDRFFAARPNLSHGDRAAIARALSRLRNQLLHHPRSTLRAAAADPAGARNLLDAVSSLFNLADSSPIRAVPATARRERSSQNH